MLKNLFILAAVAALPLAAQCCPGCGHHAPAPLKVEAKALAESPKISDSVGRAGMVASVVRTADGARILAIGGANFPNAKPGAKTPAERGAKVFYDEILSINPLDGSCSVLARLPYPIGYAAHTSKGRDMVIAPLEYTVTVMPVARPSNMSAGALTRIISISVSRANWPSVISPTTPVWA